MRDPGQTAPSLLLPIRREEWQQVPRDLDCGLTHILDWDPRSGIVTAQPGVTLEQLYKAVIGDGFWPPVSPATMKATLGECAAQNVCGDNQSQAGSFGDHVLSFDLRLPGGEIKVCSREQHAGLFYAAIGGLGVLGDFLRLRLKMKKVPSGWLQVEAIPARDLFMMMDEFEKRHAAADALAGWVDSLARGDLGRGILYQANHLQAEAVEGPGRGLSAAEQDLPRREWKEALAWLACPLQSLVCCRPGLRLLHALKYRRARRRQTQVSLAAFSFPREAAPGLVWAPRSAGLTRYQCVVPRLQARHAFAQLLKVSQDSRLASCGATLTMRRSDPFLLSPGIDGYALAIDFSVGRKGLKKYRQLKRELDAIVFQHGGAIELPPGAPLEAGALKRAFSNDRLSEFLRIKEECDPENLRPLAWAQDDTSDKQGRSSQELFKLSLEPAPGEDSLTSSQEKLPAA